MEIDEVARRVGELAWAERRLFEVVGSWVATTPEPPIKLALARQSRVHGDHVLALTEVLPDTRDHDPTALVAPPAVDPAAALDGTSDTGARLSALLDDVLPAQVATLERFVADASPVSDAPARRVVASVLDDDLAHAEALRELRGG